MTPLRSVSLQVEEEYEDILQNIESLIIKAYHELPELTDCDVVDAVQLLTRQHVAEQTRRFPPGAHICEHG